jgi:hypothetical protein
MSDNFPSPRIFKIPVANLPTFQDKLSKMARRAAKLGLPTPSYTLIKEEITTVQVTTTSNVIVVNGEEREVPVTEDRIVVIQHITLNNSSVKLAGYEFCATIEHTTEGNILHSLKGTTIPLTYRDCKSFCDHCKVMRRRNDTFIVRHVESDRYLQVGRQCLKDFLGVDAERYAAIAELYYELDELGEASEGYNGLGSGPRFDYLDVFLSYTAEVIAHDGWRSNSVAKEQGGISTSNLAYRHLHPRRGDRIGRELLFSSVSEKSVECAKAAIEWCNALSDKEVEESDYLHNIRVIARRGIVGEKQYGYAASIVSGYQRAMGEILRKEKYATMGAVSKHVGSVGDKIRITVIVNAVIGLTSQYGATTLHIMTDKDCNVFKWNSSSHVLEKGKEYLLRGTVKRHEEYKGVKQTALTHCGEVMLYPFTCVAPGGKEVDVNAEDEKDARNQFLALIGASRLKKGTMIYRKIV